MHSSFKYAWKIASSIIAIIILGVFAATFFTRSIDRSQREELLKQVNYASLLVSPSDVASLSATEEDLTNPVYQRLKDSLMIFRSFNDQIRFVYLMGYRPEIKTQFFYVDSEPDTSEDYSPPGQLFPDTRQSDIDYYLSGKPYTDGPYEDSWGKWVSGAVPLHDSSGAVIAMVGIDIATSTWEKEITFVRIVVAIITLLMCIITYSIFRYFSRKQSSIDALSVENSHLVQDKSNFDKLQSLAHIGRIIVHLEESTVMVDEQFALLFGTEAEKRFPLQQFRAAIHPDDREIFDSALAEMHERDDISYNWFDIRIGNVAQGYRLCHFYGAIERKDAGKAIRFSGIMQDITDIKR